MRALDQSDELLQRGAELRARSMRIHAAAAGSMEKSRRLIAAAAKADEAVLQAHDWESAGRRRKAAAASSLDAPDNS